MQTDHPISITNKEAIGKYKINKKQFDLVFIKNIFSNIRRTQPTRNQNDTSANNSNGSQNDELTRSDMSHRTSRCPNHRLRSDFHWYRPENPNPAAFGGSGGDNASSGNPATVFVQQDARPVVSIEPSQPAISPDVLIYDTNVQPNANVETNDVQDTTTQATDGVSFNPPNNSANNSHVSRHQSTSRCPYYRRLSMSGYQYAPSSIINYHSSLQNGNGYLRPAYAPHESLW